jgi:hypothetical protein
MSPHSRWPNLPPIAVRGGGPQPHGPAPGPPPGSQWLAQLQIPGLEIDHGRPPASQNGSTSAGPSMASVSAATERVVQFELVQPGLVV